jgi:protein-disulfide isomerase
MRTTAGAQQWMCPARSMDEVLAESRAGAGRSGGRRRGFAQVPRVCARRRTVIAAAHTHESGAGSTAAAGVVAVILLIACRMSRTTHARLNTPIGPDDHFLGPADAAVVLVEYGDYQCPHCGRAYRVIHDVLGRLGDDVRFVFRNFPLTAVHPDAQTAAEAAEAVAAHGGNDAFWDMHATLFENQDALEIDDLLGYAEACGVDPLAVADDLSTGRQRERVRADVESGTASGVTGTPAFFVNGVRYEGNWVDADAFAAALREAAATRQD